MEKVSIIIPTYNSEKYLKRCINSICNQTYKNIEIIIIDDGSTDNTFNICEEYSKKDDRVKFIHKKNEGVSVARNIGIENANGKYIMFVDSDDWIENNTVEILYNISKKEKADIVQCNFYYAYPKMKEIKRTEMNPKEGYITEKERIQLNLISSKYEEIENGVFTGAIRAMAGKLVKSEIIKIANIKFNEKICIFEDGIFLLNLAKYTNKIVFSNSYLYHYRLR